MCTTKRYFFSCQHPASHRFRNTECDENPDCTIRDESIVVSSLCRHCQIRRDFLREQRKKHSRRNSTFQAPVKIPVGPSEQVIRRREAKDKITETEVWHVPSRCFVDVGFGTLDPFGVGYANAKVQGNKTLSRVDSKVCQYEQENSPFEMTEQLSPSSQAFSSPRMSSRNTTSTIVESMQDQLWTNNDESNIFGKPIPTMQPLDGTSVDSKPREYSPEPKPVRKTGLELADCCKLGSHGGGTYMRRLEDTEARFAGRILENRCESLL